MALNNIIRRVSSSKVVPLTFRKAAGGSQRYLHHHSSAVLSTAGTLNRGGGGNLCSCTVNIFKHALPSTFHHHYSTKSVDDESLIQILNDKIKSFKGTEAEEIQEEDFPFVIVDRDEKSITLSREDEGEMVDVDVYLSNPDSETEDENETEDDDKEQVYHLWVKVSKKDRPESLKFYCAAYLDLDKISISSIFLRSNYQEPDFFVDLDENLRDAFYKYLEIRGITPRNINYLINKDIKKSVLLLEKIKKFLWE